MQNKTQERKNGREEESRRKTKQKSRKMNTKNLRDGKEREIKKKSEDKMRKEKR
jgi:hypothetical protein